MNDLNDILDCVAINPKRPPIIQLPNGLYSLIGIREVIPAEELGTNLYVVIDSDIYGYYGDVFAENEIPHAYQALGTWSTVNYSYDEDAQEWSYHQLNL